VVRSAGSSTYNWENPPVRDVVSTGQNGDEVTIRFTTDNVSEINMTIPMLPLTTNFPLIAWSVVPALVSELISFQLFSN
jgi:hypothetical protein